MRFIIALLITAYATTCMASSILSRDAHSIRGKSVSATAPTDGQVLAYNNSTGKWNPADSSGGPTYSDWAACTPTGTWVTNTTYTARCKRIGDSLWIKVKVETNGAPNATALVVTLPNSYNIDTGNIVANLTLGSELDGACKAIDNATSNYKCDILYVSATEVAPRVSTVDGSNNVIANTDVTSTVPFTFGTTDWVEFEIGGLPIVGW